jgi:hypothetical protein
MPLAILVVDRDAALEKVAQARPGSSGSGRDREQRLRLVEQEAAVAIGAGDQRVAGFGREGQGALLQLLAAVEQLAQRLVVEAVEDQHLGAAEHCGVELERGILGRRADQGDRAVLDIGQETVLLGAVEAVDLVHEQSVLRPEPGVFAGLGEDLLQVRDARENRRNRDEAQAHRVGQQPGDRGLAGAGRAPQDDRESRPRRPCGRSRLRGRSDAPGRRHPPAGGGAGDRRGGAFGRFLGGGFRLGVCGEEVGHGS